MSIARQEGARLLRAPFLLGAFVGLLAAGCGPQPEASADGGDVSTCPAPSSESFALTGGSDDDGDPAVVAVNGLALPCARGGEPLCTGVLVAPDRVLTAAHCTQRGPVVVLFGSNAWAGDGPPGEGLDGVLFRVVDTWADPDFDPGTLAHDVALLRLETQAPVTPLPLSEAPLAEGDVGREVRLVGFGPGDDHAAFAKQSGTARLSAVTDHEITYVPDPAMTCAGDSGGPVLATSGGVEVVVGVTSRGDAACIDHGIAVQTPGLLQEVSLP